MGAFFIPSKGNTLNTQIVPTPNGSPFDSIRRVNDHGEDYWSARDLFGIMAYSSWQKFETPLRRAMATAENQGHVVSELFNRSVENSGGRPREDFHLSRFAAYLVAMNGDPNMPEVAAAQAYFAIQTRVAETAPAPTGQQLLALAIVEAQRVLEQKDDLIAELEPKADAWQDLCSSSGSLSFRDAAKVISEEGGVTIGGGRLIQVLIDWRWAFRPASTPEEIAKGKIRSIRAYQTQIDAQTLTEKAKPYTDQVTGEKKLSNNPQTRITGKGLDRIRTRLLSQALEAAGDCS